MKDRTQSRENKRTAVKLSTSKDAEIDHHGQGIDTLSSILNTDEQNSFRRKLTQLVCHNLRISFFLGVIFAGGGFALIQLRYLAEVGIAYFLGPGAGSESLVDVIINGQLMPNIITQLKPVVATGLLTGVLLPGVLLLGAIMGLAGTTNITRVLRGYALVTPSPALEDDVSVTVQSVESGSKITYSTSTPELKQAMDWLYPETTATTTTPSSTVSAASSPERVSIVEFYHAPSGVSLSGFKETHTIERLMHKLSGIDADWTVQIMVGNGVKPYEASYTDETLTPVKRALASSEARDFDPDAPEHDPVWTANLRLLAVYDDTNSESVKETLSALAKEGVVTIPGTAPIAGTHRDIPVSELTELSSSTGRRGGVREKIRGDSVGDVVADIEDRTIRTKRRHSGQLRSQTVGLRVPKAGLRSLLEVREDVFESIDAEFTGDPYGETTDSMTREQEGIFLQDADSVYYATEHNENESSGDSEIDSTTSPGDTEQ
ncbi:hypothetical protein [Halorubrum sp. PV6]|uniref:hypothetical protein n=1 Tax=Halorubrum sp. PV6 TaxID=634157 RepID=UPI000F8C972A|nr:hypothetical protein [Halorubrum sp. PV6]